MSTFDSSNMREHEIETIIHLGYLLDKRHTFVHIHMRGIAYKAMLARKLHSF